MAISLFSGALLTHSSLHTTIATLARLSTPIVLSLAAATLIGVVDTIMIAPLGTVPLAAASVTLSVLILFYTALYGFVSAISVRLAETYGARDPTALSTALRTGLCIAGVAGLIGASAMLALRPALVWLGQPPEVLALLAEGYWQAMALLLVPFTLFYVLKGLFDAMGAPWLGVGVAFLAVAVNIPANWVMIHGIGNWRGLGLIGAGLASLLSESLSLVVGLCLWRRAARFRDARQPVRPCRVELRRQMRQGATIAVGYFGEGGAYGVAGLMIGWFGATALAANHIVSSIADVLYMVPLGVSIAVSILVGKAMGRDCGHEVRLIGVAALTLIIGWMALVMAAVVVLAAPLAQLLSDDPAVVTLAASMFLVIAAMQIADGVQGTMLGAARGMTDNGVPVAATLASYWVVALPLAYTLGVGLDWGPQGIWIGYGLGLAIAACLVTWRFFWRANRLTTPRPAPT